MPSVLHARCALVALLASALVAPRLYDGLLIRVWDALRTSSFYRFSGFETVWTVIWYASIEVTYTVVFMRNPSWRIAKQDGEQAKPRTKPKGMRRPSRRWMEGFIYVLPLLVMDLTMIKKFAGVPLEDMLLSGNYDVSGPAQSMHRSTFLVPSLHNMTLQSPVQTVRALPAVAPTSRRLVFELITSIVLYDALFFVFHLALHLIPPLRRWHEPHHKHSDMHPQVTNQLHITERLVLVLLANFSLNIIKSHVLTRTLFVPLFVWLLVEIHSGLDLPWGYEKILPKGWGGGARKHALHHYNGSGGFEPYFNWCDALWDRLRGGRAVSPTTRSSSDRRKYND